MKNLKLALFCIFLLTIILAVFFLIKLEPITVKIGYLPISSHLPVYIAEKENFFKDEKINVKLIQFKDSASLVNSVVNKDIDFAYESGTDVVINAMSRDPEAFKIYQLSLSDKKTPISDFLVPIGEQSISLEDFIERHKKFAKPLRVGVFPGPTARAFVSIILNQIAKYDGKFIPEIVSIPPGQPQLEALVLNRIDLLFTYEPFATILVHDAKAKILSVGPVETYLIDPWPGGVGIVSTSFIKKFPTTSSAVVRAIYKAFDFTDNNPEKSKMYLQEFSRIDRDVANKVNMSRHIKLNTSVDNLILERYVELLVKLRIIDSRVSLDNAYYIQ